ncbi:hypothetical protein SELMODRAFT_421435 [Selaginella moellendorffii]|uniref:Berberine/berberine-like domain-containing protein n=1 Tax=Selaginella moellendorffii TaxID=88036 RepID=D8SF97_SELML|nr:hypothetical protein SELMODRAFT_421435 [Selaginella moellendorffii]
MRAAANLVLQANKLFINLTPGSGTYVNEADYNEPNWQQSFFGKNYPRLYHIKSMVDPTNLFTCHHCVVAIPWFRSWALDCHSSSCQDGEGALSSVDHWNVPDRCHKFSGSQETVGWDLHGNKLTGLIPPQIGQTLVTLNLRWNKLQDAILVEIGQLKKLQNLFNSLRGPIPKELTYLQELRYVHLHENKLIGRIPPEFGELPYLRQLDVSNNHLVGTIRELLRSEQNRARDAFPSLRILYLDHNALNGRLSSAFYSHPSLKEIEFDSRYQSLFSREAFHAVIVHNASRDFIDVVMVLSIPYYYKQLIDFVGMDENFHKRFVYCLTCLIVVLSSLGVAIDPFETVIPDWVDLFHFPRPSLRVAYGSQNVTERQFSPAEVLLQPKMHQSKETILPLTYLLHQFRESTVIIFFSSDRRNKFMLEVWLEVLSGLSSVSVCSQRIMIWVIL